MHNRHVQPIKVHEVTGSHESCAVPTASPQKAIRSDDDAFANVVSVATQFLNMETAVEDGGLSGGTGSKLTRATIIVAGIASLVSTVFSIVSIWLQTKNYRKPLLQRYVVRILLMVPIYAISSWSSIISLNVAFYVEPVRDIYEAFTIYTFFQLLINFIGGERALIIMMHGREPVAHLWPLNHCLPRVDISDPHTFLAIKRGILQYAWLKPVLGLATIIMKSTHVYQEGYIGLTSGYLWSGIAYNLSVTISLYSLGMFWVCMSKDLQPFRPVPKFLCIKLIIFASYWQGFGLSILVWLGAIPDDVKGYTPDNIAAAIQDALICCEMPLFAVAHWYAFSWKDYADVTISAARLPVLYALRDAFGIRDLIEDTKETFTGNKYEYRLFDSGDNVIAHEDSSSRVARMKAGMRYERGGKGKYWIPQPGEVNARTPLLGVNSGSSRSMSPAKPGETSNQPLNYNEGSGSVEDDNLDPEEERMYAKAKKLVYGDFNYPVITANTVSRDNWRTAQPDLLTTSANRNLIQPTKGNKERRRDNIKQTVEDVQNKGKQTDSSSSGGEEGRAPMLKGMLRHHSSGSSSVKSDRSQLVDLVIEDTVAEETERVRARKEGSSGWNEIEPKRFVRTFGGREGEDIREGFEPAESSAADEQPSGKENSNPSGSKLDIPQGSEASEWNKAPEPEVLLKPKYGYPGEDLDAENVWGDAPREPPKENP